MSFGTTFGVLASAGNNQEVRNWANWTGAEDGAETSSGASIENDRIRLISVDTDKFLAIWRLVDEIKGVIITVSGTTVSFGTVVTVKNLGSSGILSLGLCLLDINKALFVYSDGSSGFLLGHTISISGTSITVNAVSTLRSAVCTGAGVVQLSTDKTVIVWKESNIGKSAICTISGTSINALGAVFQWESSSIDASSDLSASAIDSSNVLVVCGVVPNVKARILVAGVSTITAPTAATVINTTALPASVGRVSGANISALQGMAIYNTTSLTLMKGVPFSISGTVITAGTESTVQSNNINLPIAGNGAVPLNSLEMMCIFGLESTGYPQGQVADPEGTITSYAAVPISSNSAGSNGTLAACVIDNNRVLYCYFRGSIFYSKVLKTT